MKDISVGGGIVPVVLKIVPRRAAWFFLPIEY